MVEKVLSKAIKGFQNIIDGKSEDAGSIANRFLIEMKAFENLNEDETCHFCDAVVCLYCLNGMFYVKCESCEATGPHKKCEVLAVRSWRGI